MNRANNRSAASASRRATAGLVASAMMLALALSADAREATPPASQAAEGTALSADRQRQFKLLGDQIERFRAKPTNRPVADRVAATTRNPAALIADADRDPADVVLRRTAALLEDIGRMQGATDLSATRKELEELKLRNGQTKLEETDARYALYADACRLRRRVALANPLLNFKDVLFIKRGAGAEHMCDQFFGWTVRGGGGLFLLQDAFTDRPTVRDVLADSRVENGRLAGKPLAGGAFLSPDLSFDGRSILFAYAECDRKSQGWSPGRSFHVFRVNAEGTALRMLTDGSWNDFDPCFLPNGRIVFISERRGGFGRCHPRPVPTYTLHTMEPDGGDITCISFHETNEWNPSVNHDGMIVYTRWDYVDRNSCQAHHPWITAPDGRDARAIQGNYPRSRSDRPDAEMDVQAVPGSRKYVATAAPHHGQSYGSLILIDPDITDDRALSAVRRLTPEVPFPETEGGGPVYATAWPLSEDYFLAAYSPSGRDSRTPHGLYLVDSFGNKELLYGEPAIGCTNPIPMRARPVPPVVAHQTAEGRPGGPRSVAAGPIATDPAERAPPMDPTERVGPAVPTTGPETITVPAGWPQPRPAEAVAEPELATVVVVNVYDGTLPWPAGTKIAALRVIQVLPKTTVRSGDPPINYTTGTESTNARAVLGTVPVEPDGSAHFLAPIHRPIYFQALDDRGLAVQSMRSDTYLHRGEKLTCRGCHEPANRSPAPPVRAAAALSRPPSRIAPDIDGSNPFSFPRLVQPVLDRHCVSCHETDAKAAKTKLTGAPPPPVVDKNGRVQKDSSGWFISYINLRPYAFHMAHCQKDFSLTTPGAFGARASGLFKLLEAGHYDAKLSSQELHRITLWLDCNSDFYGSYEHIEAQGRGEIVKPTLE